MKNFLIFGNRILKMKIKTTNKISAKLFIFLNAISKEF